MGHYNGKNVSKLGDELFGKIIDIPTASNLPNKNGRIYTPISFDKIIFPIIKNISPVQSIQSIFSVQPMSAPQGLTFYLDFRYAEYYYAYFEELWWEDTDEGGLYCPQTLKDWNISLSEFCRMRDQELLFEDWEINEINKYI